MKIKISTKTKEIKTKNYEEKKDITFDNFIDFYIGCLKLSFPNIKINEVLILEFLLKNDLETDYFSSENIGVLSKLLKSSLSNIRNFIKPSLIKSGLIVNVNPNPKSFTLNRYLLNDSIKNFIKYLKENKENINNIEIKFDFNILKT